MIGSSITANEIAMNIISYWSHGNKFNHKAQHLSQILHPLYTQIGIFLFV